MTTMSEQLRQEDLAGMSSEEIAKALKDGRCDVILGVRPTPVVALDPAKVDALADDPDALAEYVRKVREADDSDRPGTAAWLRQATPQEITAALAKGELDGLLQ